MSYFSVTDVLVRSGDQGTVGDRGKTNEGIRRWQLYRASGRSPETPTLRTP